MPGAQPAHFRKGNNAEIFAEYVLRHIAFTSQVPREEDVGHDFLCSMIVDDGALLRAGPFFTAQVKSNKEPLVYQEGPERDWIINQDNPFFVIYVETMNHAIEIYSTWPLLLAVLRRLQGKIRLLLREPKPGAGLVNYHNRGGAKTDIYLGKPILRIKPQDLSVANTVNEYREILAQWIELDRRNIVLKGSKMYWVSGPTEYSTNVRLNNRTHWTTTFFCNPNNIEGNVDNFVRTSIALFNVIQELKDQGSGVKAEVDSFMDTLKAQFQQHRELFREYEHDLRVFANIHLDE